MYKKDRLRRSMMFVPGNNPGMIRDARIYGADSIMFDLEDSVAYTEKDAARFLVYNALRTLHFGKKEIVVRINDLSSGLGIEDLEAVVRRLPFFLQRKKGRKERRQNQGFGILSAGGVLPASVPFRRANGNEQISFLAFALPLRLHPLAAHAGPRCPGTAGVPSAPIAQCITFSLTPQ